MTRASVRATVLAAALAGCGVKAAPRPPERPGSEARERRATGAPAPDAAAPAGAAAAGPSCGCARPDPLFAVTTQGP